MFQHIRYGLTPLPSSACVLHADRGHCFLRLQPGICWERYAKLAIMKEDKINRGCIYNDQR